MLLIRFWCRGGSFLSGWYRNITHAYIYIYIEKKSNLIFIEVPRMTSLLGLLLPLLLVSPGSWL